MINFAAERIKKSNFKKKCIQTLTRLILTLYTYHSGIAAEVVSDSKQYLHIPAKEENAKFDTDSTSEISSPENTITLSPITVFASPNSLSLTIPSYLESKDNLDQVPGGTSLIEGQKIYEGASFTINDTLAYTPGVYVGDSQAGVAGGSRISIRGSDINSQIIPISGIKFLRNGTPFTNANGFTDTETLNLKSIKHIEVFRGANALEYGGSNLGGAINFITPTGHNADPLRIGMTFGTDGYITPHVSGGGEFGNGWDAYGSYSYVDFNGNRDNSDQKLFYGYGNIGYRWNQNNESRLHLDIQDINSHLPFGLTKQQLEENPHQTNANLHDKSSGFPVYRVDLQHSIRFDNSGKLNVAAYYFTKDNSYNFQDFGFLYDLWQDAGFSWHHQINSELFGFSNRFVWGGLAQWLWINDREFQPNDGKPAFLRFNEKDNWNNVEVYFQNQLQLTTNFNLIIGGQINYRTVEIERITPRLNGGLLNTAEQAFFNFNPKLGFTWQVLPEAQFYANISRSAEPPPINDLLNIFQSPKLTSQTGTTIEIGTRGGNKGFKWDLAIYHAWLYHELLTIPSPPLFVNFDTLNAKNTQHTGIELGLEATFPLNITTSEDKLRLRGSYTWSRFEFDNDLKLGNNRLPGIPEHNARIEALYQHPTGLYFGPNLAVVGSNWVDFTNTLSANPYVLVGARLGWDDGKHWKFFIDGRNLTNEYYAASVYVSGDSSSAIPTGRGTMLFSPGATRMVFAGFEFRY